MEPSQEAIETIRETIAGLDSLYEIDEALYGNGVCFSCGELKEGDCEPDAAEYLCSECGEYAVYGFELALMYVLI